MLKIPLNEEIITYSKKLVDRTNFGKRGFADGNKRNQYIGIVGENTIRDYLGIELMTGLGGFDGGYDIDWNGYKADVKCMERKVDPKDYYVNNVLDTQIGYVADAFIFASINRFTKVLTVCGWVTKEEFKERGNYYPKGTIRTRKDGTTFELYAGNWEIENKYLNSFLTFNK